MIQYIEIDDIDVRGYKFTIRIHSGHNEWVEYKHKRE